MTHWVKVKPLREPIALILLQEVRKIMFVVKFTADINRVPAAKSFSTLIEARRYELSYPNFAAQIYVNGVAFDGGDYSDLMAGDITQSQMIARYIQDKRLTDAEVVRLRQAT